MHLPEGKLGKLKWLVGIFLTALSIYSLFNEYRLLNQGIYTKAKIIDLKCLILPERINPLCLPIVEFNTQTGQRVVYQLNLNQALLLSEKRNQLLTLYYQDINPQNVVVNNFTDKYLSYLWDVLLASVAFIRKPKKREQYIRV